MIQQAPTRPLLRYFGGKWQMRSWIIEHLPPHDYYAEPFAGAASILLAKPPAPKGEIINDLNGDLINLFRVMQSREEGNELMRRLEWTPYAQAEFKAAREEVPGIDAVERARNLLIRSFMGIEVAGVKTTHTAFRMGNVDLRRFGKDGPTFRNCAADWENWKQCAHLICERIARVMIYQRDAFEFIDLMDAPGCLLYVDPPYAHETRSGTRYEVEFTDHAGLIDRLVRARAMVVLSGYDCAEYAALTSAGWARVERKSRANMSKNPRTECLWISPSARLNNQNLFSQGMA